MKLARTVSAAAVRPAVPDLSRPDPTTHAEAEEAVRETAEDGEDGLTYLEAYAVHALPLTSLDLTSYAVEGGVRLDVETDEGEVEFAVLRDVREMGIAAAFLRLGLLARPVAAAG